MFSIEVFSLGCLLLKHFLSKHFLSGTFLLGLSEWCSLFGAWWLGVVLARTSRRPVKARRGRGGGLSETESRNFIRGRVPAHTCGRFCVLELLGTNLVGGTKEKEKKKSD